MDYLASETKQLLWRTLPVVSSQRLQCTCFTYPHISENLYCHTLSESRIDGLRSLLIECIDNCAVPVIRMDKFNLALYERVCPYLLTRCTFL